MRTERRGPSKEIYMKVGYEYLTISGEARGVTVNLSEPPPPPPLLLLFDFQNAFYQNAVAEACQTRYFVLLIRISITRQWSATYFQENTFAASAADASARASLSLPSLLPRHFPPRRRVFRVRKCTCQCRRARVPLHFHSSTSRYHP